MVVATALCADRASAAAPQQAKPQVAQLARTVANRLTASFRRVVPAVRFVENRTAGACDVLVCPPAEAGSPTRRHASDGSPFRFRLPPPSL